jgi:hypothetical protein
LLGELDGCGRILEGAVSVAAGQPNPSPDEAAAKIHEVSRARLRFGEELVDATKGRIPAALPVVLVDPVRPTPPQLAGKREALSRLASLGLQLKGSGQLAKGEQQVGQVAIGSRAMRRIDLDRNGHRLLKINDPGEVAALEPRAAEVVERPPTQLSQAQLAGDRHCLTPGLDRLVGVPAFQERAGKVDEHQGLGVRRPCRF